MFCKRYSSFLSVAGSAATGLLSVGAASGAGRHKGSRTGVVLDLEEQEAVGRLRRLFEVSKQKTSNRSLYSICLFLYRYPFFSSVDAVDM